MMTQRDGLSFDEKSRFRSGPPVLYTFNPILKIFFYDVT